MRVGSDDNDCEGVFGKSVRESVVDRSEIHHVLAVDDCVIDRKVIERLLRTDSVRVTAVESAARALELLGVNEGQFSLASSASENAFNFSMIITDYCMPGMTGYDLLKKLKEIKGLKEIPVVIMSSENIPHRVQRCLAEGAKDFIIKPVKLKDIHKLRGLIKISQPVAASTPTNASSAISPVGNANGSTCKKKRNKVVHPVGFEAAESTVRRVRPRVGGVTVA